MNSNFESLIDDFFRERTNEIVVALQTDNSNYQKLYRKIVDNSEVIEKICEGNFSLSPDDFNSLRAYITARQEVGLTEYFALYGSGYLDCIRLMKKLQLL